MSNSWKSWFTLIEMLIVLVLVGILMTAFKTIFQTKDQTTLYAQNCINMVYGELNNFLNSAMTSKWLYTGNQTIYPDFYQIAFKESNNRIDLIYQNKDFSGIQKTYMFSWWTPKNFNCYNNSYHVAMSGNSTRDITMTKGFSNQWEEIPFQIKHNNQNILTWDIIFYACSYDWSHCQEIGKLSLDTRSKQISKALCIAYTWTDNTQCLYRDK